MNQAATLMSHPPITRGNSAAVVITYHPDDGFSHRLSLLAAQVSHVIIVDNRSSDDELLRLGPMLRSGNARDARDACDASQSTIELIENPENLGVATALNRGAKRAIELGFAWLLMMDQDTAVGPDLLDGLAQTYCACPFRDEVGLVAANFMVHVFARAFATCSPTISTADQYIEQPIAITSGSLISLNVYRKTGRFRDEFFIDFVDNEYCLRLASLGYRVIHSRKVLIDHAIGEPRRYKLLWLRPVSSNHSPLRRYYITRNRLRTNAWYFSRFPRVVMQDYYRIFGEMFLFTMLEPQKLAKLAATFLGMWHAVIGRTGRLDQLPWERK